LKEIHQQYQLAGADIIYSATFGANRIKLSEQKINNVEKINKELYALAKEAVGKNCLVAADIGPLGEFIKPLGNLDFEEAVSIFKEQVNALSRAGADLFVIETMMDIQEARAALLAVKEACDKWTIVTMTFEASGRTLYGTTPLSALITLQALGADSFGANCSTGPKDMLGVIKSIKPYAKVFLTAKPNAGLPKFVGNKTVFDMETREFALFAKKFVSSGVNLIGGCCGTTPQHILETKNKIVKLTPTPPLKKSIAALSSSRESLILEKQKDILIIGESINPTGKKLLREELKTGKFTLVRKLAKEQEVGGAHLLDVNVAVTPDDEEKIMLQAISVLLQTTKLPLVIDSSNVKVIEQALRFYPGRALINSISGEERKMKPLLSLAKKYGAIFILLPVVGKVPQSFKERKKVIQKILKEAKKAGFCKDDMIIDALVMTISSHPDAAKNTFKTIQWCKKILKIKSLIGLSNISFGLPKRQVLNTTFLNLARKQGLSLAIANPLQNNREINKLAKGVLLNKDKALGKFLKYYSTKSEAKDILIKTPGKIEEEIYQAIIEGNKQDISSFLKRAIKEGKNPLSLMQGVLIPAIVKVGGLFEKKQYFLPQLVASAEAMKEGALCLAPYLKNKTQNDRKAIVILATVEGDIHDIGKNIVSLMLLNHGFKIIDLGKDVCAQKIIQAIKLHHPDIVGLSALMTTTMVNMKKVIELAKSENLNCKFMIGGAVVTSGYAESIGASYAKDGVSAVHIAKNLSANT
jgi:5-methyltetrahydrofolate--homocysteine methyltransferase